MQLCVFVKKNIYHQYYYKTYGIYATHEIKTSSIFAEISCMLLEFKLVNHHTHYYQSY